MKKSFVNTFRSDLSLANPLSNTGSTGRRGELRLRFALQNETTVLTEKYFRTPLQVMRPIYDSAGVLCVYLLSPTGGVVQGDEYCMDVILEPGTHALLTSQAATKVYRMPRRGATQVIHIDIQENAVLEYLPDAVILFKDADLVQEINVTLRPGALLILQDIVMPGRLARGEILQFRRYANRLMVRDSDGLILYDNVDYQPAADDAGRIGLFDGCPCWGSWYLIGDLQRIHLNADRFCQNATVPWQSDALGSISTLHRSGLSVRMVSRSLTPLYTTFTALWQTVRTQHLGLPPGALRK